MESWVLMKSAVPQDQPAGIRSSSLPEFLDFKLFGRTILAVSSKFVFVLFALANPLRKLVGQPLVGGLDWFGDLMPWFVSRVNLRNSSISPPNHQSTGLQTTLFQRRVSEKVGNQTTKRPNQATLSERAGSFSFTGHRTPFLFFPSTRREVSQKSRSR